MKLLVHKSRVDGGRVAHQQQSAGYAQDQGYLRVVLPEVDAMVPADGLQEEVVGHPAEDDQDCSRDGARPEDHELRIVLCDFASFLVTFI